LADRDDIIAHHAAGTPPELFVERMHRHRSDEIGKAFRATLMNLHNDGTIDVLEPARTIGASSIDQHQFFTVMHVYCDLIPALEAEVPAMPAAVKTLVARAGADGASGMPNGAYRTWAAQGARARATLAAIDPADPEDAAYVFLGLQALAKTEPDAALDAAIAYLTGTAAPARFAAAKAILWANLGCSASRQASPSTSLSVGSTASASCDNSGWRALPCRSLRPCCPPTKNRSIWTFACLPFANEGNPAKASVPEWASIHRQGGRLPMNVSRRRLCH
jgi:hypothetical protein